MNQRIIDHLINALRELALAQTLADAATSESFCRDIPAGHPTKYAVAHAFAHDITRIRSEIRALADLPRSNVLVRPIPRTAAAIAGERHPDLDIITGQRSDVVHGAGSTTDRADAPA